MNYLAMLAETVPIDKLHAAGEQAGGFLKFLLENPLGFTLAVVLVAAIIGAFVAARKLDRCLKRFRDYSVTIRRQDGGTLWGRIRIFSNGIELLYEQPALAGAKRSVLLYEAELGRIAAIYRFLDRLAIGERARRDRQVRVLVHLRVSSRLWRGLANVFNTFRDALGQAFAATLQQVTRTVAPPAATAAAAAPISSLGTTLAGSISNAYEPMLEQHLARPVIVELVNPAAPEKPPAAYSGLLGLYSDKYILLIDVRQRFTEEAPLGGAETRLIEGAVGVREDGGRLVVENGSAVTVTIEAITASGGRHEIAAAVPAGESGDVPLPDGATAESATAVLSYERSFDLIVPRAWGAVRHGAA